ncbi:MAG TPA: M20 family metallopeptidase [Clostridia bacterium]|nr:M20 family metallopeptidase [Clostridia bacterium]
MKRQYKESALLQYMENQVPAMLSLLQALVELESPSGEKAYIDKLVDFLGCRFRELGLLVEVREGPLGNHLIVTRNAGDEKAGDERAEDENAGDDVDTGGVHGGRTRVSDESGGRYEAPGGKQGRGVGQILILCHVDTVWDAGEIADRPFEVIGDKAYGPGVLDMKGGIVQTYFAFKALKDLGMRTGRRIRALFTPDEEQGSSSSYPIIEEEARQSAYVLVPEPAAAPSGGLKTGRKGIAKFKVHISGRASHAGGDPQRGRSAIEELAHQILRLHALTDYEVGTSVNVGVVRGGTRSNIVAASAEAEVDVRFCTMDEGERVKEVIMNLSPVLPDIEISVTGGIERPPMTRTPEGTRLFRIAKGFAQDLGFDVCEEFSGGASDGNFTATMGVPTLDGLGPVGAGSHATNEHVVIASLPQRAALMAKLLAAL